MIYQVRCHESPLPLRDVSMIKKTDPTKSYWQTNLRYLATLLSVWFVVSYGFGILFVDQLNRIRVGGFYLGFWFAQQGAIYVFVILIIVYVQLMKRLDKKYKVNEAEDRL